MCQVSLILLHCQSESCVESKLSLIYLGNVVTESIIEKNQILMIILMPIDSVSGYGITYQVCGLVKC